MPSETIFEWDEGKNLVNIQKHGIRFADAVEVFSDPRSITFMSKADHGEPRYLIVGRVNESLVTVIFTMRADRIRIISARRSRKEERRLYDH